MGSWIGNLPSGGLPQKESSFTSTFSLGTVLHLKGAFFAFFAGVGEVEGEVTSCSTSESDSKTSVSSSVSDSMSESSKYSDSSLSEDKSLSYETSGLGNGLAGTKTFFLE